jgi:hypothetical protein
MSIVVASSIPLKKASCLLGIVRIKMMCRLSFLQIHYYIVVTEMYIALTNHLLLLYVDLYYTGKLLC